MANERSTGVGQRLRAGCCRVSRSHSARGPIEIDLLNLRSKIERAYRRKSRPARTVAIAEVMS